MVRVMRKLRILITAGPTREPIDPVRFISNRSSGKMGFALAEAARKAGHDTILVSGPVSLPPPRGVRLTAVETADEMRRAVLREARHANLIIMAAAVADYTPAEPARQKIKKNAPTLRLLLRKTPDILQELGKRKTSAQTLVGFAAETSLVLPRARAKLIAKNLDFIVANRVGIPGSGFESTHNLATVLARDGRRFPFPRLTKRRLAGCLLTLFTKSM
ncbi:MAG: phosphopantothenoylcysteine decarboxylase [Verrucomicrobiae bacterium]|nr:phosphopantothenoylcysteine decarboxylase [Verrucomicrobiae bacterium]